MKNKKLLTFGLFIILATCIMTACGSSFSIVGKWKNVGTETFGQAQQGCIVAFNGTNCNLYSPQDTYAFSENEDGTYSLDLSAYLTAENVHFDVEVVNNDYILIYYGSYPAMEFQRVE